MDYKKALERNIRLDFLVTILVHFELLLPVWVAFYTRILSFSEIALLHVVYGVTTFALELPTGALADLIGRKKTIMIGWGIIGIGLIIAAFSQTFSVFLISYALRGVGAAFVSGADSALVYDTFKELGKPQDYSKYVARVGFFARISLAVGSLFGGYAYLVWFGLPHLFGGVLHLVALLLIWFMVEPRIDSEKFTLQNYVKQTREGIKQLLQNTFTKRLSLFYVLVGGITWSCLMYFNQPFAKDVGFGEVGMSWLFSGLYLASSLIVLFVTHRTGLLTRERAYLGFPLIMVVALLPAYVATIFTAPFMLLLVLVAGSGRFAILNQYVNEEFLSKYRATALSTLNMFVNLIAYAFIGVSGYIQDVYNTKVIFTALGILTVLIVVPSSYYLVKAHRSGQIPNNHL